MNGECAANVISSKFDLPGTQIVDNALRRTCETPMTTIGILFTDKNRTSIELSIKDIEI